jgi:hypothetical protein
MPAAFILVLPLLFVAAPAYPPIDKDRLVVDAEKQHARTIREIEREIEEKGRELSKAKAGKISKSAMMRYSGQREAKGNVRLRHADPKTGSIVYYYPSVAARDLDVGMMDGEINGKRLIVDEYKKRRVNGVPVLRDPYTIGQAGIVKLGDIRGITAEGAIVAEIKDDNENLAVLRDYPVLGLGQGVNFPKEELFVQFVLGKPRPSEDRGQYLIIRPLNDAEQAEVKAVIAKAGGDPK